MEQLTIHNGRPLDISERQEKEINAYDLLDSLKIEYFRVDHEKTDTMEACAGIDKILGITICKNLFLCNRQKTKFYLLLMPGDKPFKTKELSKQIGSARLSFASAEDMEKYLNITPGSVSVLGLMNDKDGDVTLLIDEDVLKDEFFGCHPLVNTSSLKFRTTDLTEKILPAMKHDFSTVILTGEE